MALKGNWIDKVDGVDYVLSKDINDIAHSVIEVEEAIEDMLEGGGSGGGTGQDGFSPIASVVKSGNAATISITDKNGTTQATVYDGEKGDKGDPGKTPVKGIDYFDGNDGAPGKDGTVQIDPLFAESVEWLEVNGDTTKLYILPDNRIYGYIYSDAGEPAYTNWLPVADTTTRISGDDTTAGQNGYVSGVRLNSSGVLKAQSGYSATGFIPYTYQGADDAIRIKGAALASGSYTQELCFYDDSHAFLGYAGFSGTDYEELMNSATNNTVGWKIEKDSDGEYTLIWKPSETNIVKNGTVDTSKIAFVRIGMGDFANAVITINEEITGDSGSTAGYRWAWTGNYLVSPADTSDVGTTRDYVKKRNTYIMPVPSGYCESKLTFTDLSTKVTEVFKSEANLAEMMRRFSALATAHPHYVTETLLGKDASNTYNIYKYEMDLPHATDTGVTSVMEKDKPVFIITAGLHGIEPDAVIEVYHFMRDLCENFVESDQLDYLRTNVKFVIVPISNPWGFVNGTYTNSNNVNLNKNFEHGFSPVTGATNPQLNSGTAAYSEAEAVLLKSVFDTYKNAVFHLECHGKAGADNAYNDVIWFSLMQSLKSECAELCANSVIHQIGRRLYKMGYNPDKTEGGYITYYNLNGRPKDYTGTEYGMMSATMEGTGRMAVAGHTVFTKDEQRINCEALENFVLQVMGALNSLVEI